jgi:hypothetical protein
MFVQRSIFTDRTQIRIHVKVSLPYSKDITASGLILKQSPGGQKFEYNALLQGDAHHFLRRLKKLVFNVVYDTLTQKGKDESNCKMMGQGNRDVKNVGKYPQPCNLLHRSNKSSPITGLERPLGFQEVEVPRFFDSRHIKMVRLSALRTGRLYPPRKYSRYSFQLEAESTPGP